ncbi:helix-turn-helix domain-containing protein [Caloranaerobacter sp. DY30410]|uniref:helix-turn-helix domain-containing protein n=1 Tax=Caloranaerobacter sp. DY30410 TaxID=3238305 RepID=UPI003CFFB32B
MISLQQKAEILLKYFREGVSQREISRELGISRDTVRKYINEFEKKLQKLEDESDEKNILLLIEEMVLKPKYDTSKRKKVKLTDEVIEIIDNCLKENEKRNLQENQSK